MGNAHFLLEEKFMRPNLLQIQLHTMLTLQKRHQGLQFCAEGRIEEGRKEGVMYLLVDEVGPWQS